MKVVLCEKPMVGRAFVSGLSSMLNTKSSKKDGFEEVGDYIVTWAFGHLLKLDTEGGDWGREYPKSFDYVPVDASKKQFKIVSQVLQKADEIIIATDPGREGELIARLIINESKLKKKVPIKRFWTSETLTDEVIEKMFKKGLDDGSKYDSLYYEALARQHADALVGINLSRKIRECSLARGRWSVGRVQTPTLAVLVRRENEINHFKPEPYVALSCDFEKDGVVYSGTLEREKGPDGKAKLLKKDESDKIVAKITGKTGKVIEYSSKTKKERPPTLHTITSAQIAANKAYGFGASKTAELLQSLYEKSKCISYPRTESHYLSSSDESVNLVKSIMKKIGRADLIDKIDASDKNVFNDAKLTDHHALIPTDVCRATGDELKIYELIKNSFMAVFYPDAVSESFTVRTQVDDFVFATKGVQDKVKGWREVLRDGKDRQFTLVLKKDDDVDVKKVNAEEKMTTPPSRYTEGELLKVMENAHLLLPEEETEKRKLMKEKENAGLGTGATRAGIISRLGELGYYVLEKKFIKPTEKGMNLIKVIEDSSITDPMLTADWEQLLKAIRLGETNYDKFMSGIWGYVQDEGRKLEGSEEIKKLGELSGEGSFVEECPVCKAQALSVFKSGVKCGKCDFSAWKKFSGKILTDKEFDKVRHGEPVFVKNFVSKKTGKKFDAWIELKDGRVQFNFEKESGKVVKPKLLSKSFLAESAKSAVKPRLLKK